MKKKIRVNITIDEDIKENATNIFEEFGFDFSTGINLYLREVCRKKTIPFELNLSDTYPKETVKALKEYHRYIKHH